MQADVLNKEGNKTGRSIELPDDIFAMEPDTHAIYLSVKHYQASQRQGTSKVKNRNEVKGSSRKLHKQKGTGGSRKGNIRNPLFKGGGTVFGPQPRDYGFKLNRKQKDLARISALSLKVKEGRLRVVEDFDFEKPGTRGFMGFLKALQIDPLGQRTLFITPEFRQNLYLSLRNIPSVNGMVLSDINTYDILNAQFLVLTEQAARLFTGEEAPSEA